MNAYIELRTTMPRRLFVPLSMILGNNFKTLYQQALETHRLAVYWRDLKNREAWHVETLDNTDERLGRRLPRSLWQSSLKLMQVEDAQNARDAREELEAFKEEDTHYLDISLGVTAHGKEAGLYIAFNPRPSANTSKISGLFIGDDRPPVKWHPQLHGGQYCLLLHVPRLALLPLQANEVAPPSPPKSFLNKLVNFNFGRLWQDCNWQFRPNEGWFALIKSMNPQPSSPRSFIAVDFGTTASTIACLPEQPTGEGQDMPFTALHHLRSWTHSTYTPNFVRQQEEGSRAVQAAVWGSTSPLINGTFEAVPRHIRSNRIMVQEKKDTSTDRLATTPSFLCALSAEGAERVTAHNECAIGVEAGGFLSLAAKGVPINLKGFVFAPKRLVGSDMQSDRIRKDLLRHFEPKFDPIEGYLRELFDQALHVSLQNTTPIRERLSNLCYSYPVAWTESQRKDMEKRLRSALDQSFLHEFLPDKKTTSEIGSAYRMDEASAAFMGLLLERFQGLEGDHLVRTFAPFEPDQELAQSYPKALHVLVVDCGGGTTDMVLLHIEDTGAEGQDVHSRVKKHFAIDQGGLEITRRIAEYLKSLLKHYEKMSEAQLRTNLNDEDLDKTVVDWSNVNLGEYRRRFIIKLYEVAERLKIEVSDNQDAAIRWGEVVNIIQSGQQSMMGIDTSGLPSSLELDRLSSWTQGTYRTVINQIERWFSVDEMPAVDFVLLSGRSSQLPGLRNAIIHAIPAEKRPLATDFAEVGNYAFSRAENNNLICEKEAAKNLVCAGLALNHWNIIGQSHRKAIKSHPIDETRRTRAIGILDETIDNRPREYFLPQQPLLIEADNEAVDLEAEYTYAITKATSRGFYLGINFSGKPAEGKPEVDPPQPFIRIDVDGGEKEVFAKLEFVFQQLSSTEIKVKQIIMHKEDGPTSVDNIAMKPNSDTGVVLGKMHIFIRPYLQVEDFRMTGRIHLAEKPLDHDSISMTLN